MTDHLSPRRLAEAVGVSESSIKRWVDAGRIGSTLTAGGHRRIPLASAIRFVREYQAGPVDPSSLGISVDPSADLGSTGTIAGEALYSHVLHGRSRAALDFVRALYVSGHETARIIDEPFRAAMERLGKLWHELGAEGVFLEHRATQIGLRLLHELRAIQDPPSTSAPIALGGAPAGDPYLLPTLAVAVVLESAGFSASNLGPDSPDGAFVSAIDSLRPGLVWLSLTARVEASGFKRSLRVVGEAVDRAGASLVLGGQASVDLKLDEDSVSFRGDSLVELAAFARGVCCASRRR
jgi:excisionase family DNA binding protein